MLFRGSFWGCLTPAENTQDCFARVNAGVPVLRISVTFLLLTRDNFFSNVQTKLIINTE